MEIVAWILVPLLLAGLAWITYRNPPVARKIVTAGIAAAVTLLVTRVAYHIGKQDAFYAAVDHAYVASHESNEGDTVRTTRSEIAQSISRAAMQESEEANSFFTCCAIATGTLLVFFVLAYALEYVPRENGHGAHA